MRGLTVTPTRKKKIRWKDWLIRCYQQGLLDQAKVHILADYFGGEKGRDGSWISCVDYPTLDKAITPDKCPITLEQ